eukprot:Clim_evm6s21 gene=Clim_evmTU6s21
MLKKVAIVGAGGVGGYLGARLIESALFNVSFLVRERTLDAFKRNGLVLKSIAGDYHSPNVTASTKAADLGPVDYVFITTKPWQVKDLAPSLSPLLHSDTVLIPLQNGVSAPENLKAVAPESQIAPGVFRIIAYIKEAGTIVHEGAAPEISFNEYNNERTERINWLFNALEQCKGIKPRIPDDIHKELWEKFAFISACNVCAASQSSIRTVLAVPESKHVFQQILREVCDVAKAARGLDLDPDNFVQQVMARLANIPKTSTSSLSRDIADGKPSELEDQIGDVVRHGQLAGVNTPYSAAIYGCLLPLERQARGIPIFDDE